MRTLVLNLLSVVLTTFTSVPEGGIPFAGTTLELGRISYYVPPEPVSQLKFGLDVWKFAKYNDVEFIPFSVVSVNENGSLVSTFNDWKDRDDVWSERFLTGLCVKDRGLVSPFVRSNYNVKFIFKTPVDPIPSGPYFLSPYTGKVYQAYRLYNDENQAFVYGVIPAFNGSYRQLSAYAGGVQTPSIGVPSRLYFTPTVDKPLAGYRLAVKDIYDVAGLKTGCGSRAYYQTYPEKNTTALSVQRLVDAGMVIIGKVKTSQFANGERATDDWVDYHAPYNARGDGYQDASSSSTGSGSAMSSYDWVDFALGSDTGGSMRGPAGRCGLYGNRPSHGAVPLNDVMPLSPALDTAGIFARDAVLWAQVGKVWYTDLKDYTSYPNKLLFPVDVFGRSYITQPPEDGTADAILDSFLKKVEGFLGVSRTEVNLTTMWTETRPSDAAAADSFDALLNTTFSDIMSFDSLRLVGNSFIKTYGEMNGGRTPFVNPSPALLWSHAQTISESRYKEALANKTIFQSWVTSQVLQGGQPDTCSDAILVYPQSIGATVYRNEFIAPPTISYGFTINRFSVHSGVPDMVVPVGETAYQSSITNTVEYLPVTMSFVAAKSCDLMLFNLFADLQEQGILSKVTTGPRLF